MNKITEKVINTSELDHNFKMEIAGTHEGRTVLWCVQCGMCSSNCPYANVLDVQLHQVIKMIQLGMRKEALNSESIWMCATCFMCTERCPQGVEVGNVMFALKNIVAKEKGIPNGFKIFGQNVYNMGRTMEIPGHRIKEREKLGLPKVPQTDDKKIKEMLKKIKLDRLVEA